MAWTVAPSKLSTVDPMVPARIATGKKRQSRVSAHPRDPIKPAPLKIAKYPKRLTAPEVPRGTRSPVVIKRGRRRERIPISVAQVSAVATAIAPTNPANQKLLCVKPYATANKTAAPPLAITWPRSRFPLLENIPANWRFRDLPRPDKRLDERKKVIKRTASGIPPKPKVNPPTRNAPIAPSSVSALAA